MKFTCPHCQTQLECDDSFAGSTADCPTCGKPLVIQASPSPLRATATPKFRVVPPRGARHNANGPAPGAGPAIQEKSPKPRSKKKRIIGIVLLVVALIFLLGKCSNEQPNSVGNKDAAKAQFVRIADKRLKSLGANIDVEWDGDALVVTLMQKGLTTAAGFAASGTEPFVSQWNTLKFTLLEKSHEISNALMSKGFDDHLMINFLDADNLNNPLLVILDGAVIYDATLQ